MLSSLNPKTALTTRFGIKKKLIAGTPGGSGVLRGVRTVSGLRVCPNAQGHSE